MRRRFSTCSVPLDLFGSAQGNVVFAVAVRQHLLFIKFLDPFGLFAGNTPADQFAGNDPLVLTGLQAFHGVFQYLLVGHRCLCVDASTEAQAQQEHKTED